jgi:MFS family permease/predicted Ser/Thr protein kinase
LGRYELVGRLGEGGQGVVFQGRAPDGVRVAVKLLRVGQGGDEAARRRFVRELSAAERVAGFCTARVLDADIEGDTPYIASEYVDGPSLQDLVREQGPRTGDDLLRLAIATVTALAAIHEAKIVHRDFKPPNVLMSPDGPRVIDFGIARALDAPGTLTSQVVGTPAYMAPEQVAGAPLGPAADMFAWGSTILFAATGRSPFGAVSIPAVMHRVLHVDADVSMLPQPLAALVNACLNKDPARRPAATDVLLSLLGRAVPGQAVAATETSPILAAGASAATAEHLPPAQPPTWPLAVPPGMPPPPAPAGMPPPAFAPSAGPATSPRRGLPGVPVLALLATALAAFTVMLGEGMLSAAYPAVATQLDGGIAFLSAIGDYYQFALAAAVLPAGRIADAVGRKKVFLAGLAAYAVVTVLLTLVPTRAMFLALRILQGAAAGLVLSAGLGVIRDMFPGRRGLLALAAWAAAVVVPMTDGGFAGRLIVEYLGWRLLFPALLVPLLAAGALGLAGARESRSRGPENGVIGVMLLSLLVPLLTYGLRHHGWLEIRTLLPLALALVLAVVGVVLGLTVRPSPLPLRACGGTAVFALGLWPAYATMTYVGYRLQESWGLSAFGTGARLLPLAMTALVCALAGGALAGRFGARTVLAGGCAVTGVAALAAYPAARHDAYLLLLPVVALLGVGLGAAVTGAAGAIVGEAPDGLAGLGGGLLQAGMLLGGSVSVPFFSISSPAPLIVAGVVGIAAAVPALLLRSGPPEQTGPPLAYASPPAPASWR